MAHSDSKATECVVLIKPDGTIHGPYKAAFSRNIIRVFGQSIEVADGDCLERPLCNGDKEIYSIEKATFVRGLSVSLDNWKMVVRKDNLAQESEQVQFPNNGVRSSSQNLPGDFNIQKIVSAIQSLTTAICASEVDEKDKADAKLRLQAFLSHPVVSAILGSAAVDNFERINRTSVGEPPATGAEEPECHPHPATESRSRESATPTQLPITS